MDSLFRTYKRRQTTRTSGFHTCDETTGGECIVAFAEEYTCKAECTILNFFRKKMQLNSIFSSDKAILAFGGYIKASNNIKIEYEFSYKQAGISYNSKIKKYHNTIEKQIISCFGSHIEIPLKNSFSIQNVNVKMTLNCPVGTILNFIQVDFDCIKYEAINNEECGNSFNQKTDMHVPTLYYFNSFNTINKYLREKISVKKGCRIILKSCNRCGRFLPINIDNELNTVAFSLHCKKNAPCRHSNFMDYKIQNINELAKNDLKGLNIKDNKIISYYGHQLECKACKKFFVNKPLNPLRNAQQFKEDGLRRRALEVLVNTLLDTHLIHFEYEFKTKKEFSKHIWEKFNKKCFKCGKELKLKDMALDHTMPLAYLYRLDETATCLCSSHNSAKRDKFPVEYYSKDELKSLSKITGIPYNKIIKKEVNKEVYNLLLKQIVWFYDEFLAAPEYQKKRGDIKTADKIQEALNRIIGNRTTLINAYKKRTGHYPTSITINN